MSAFRTGVFTVELTERLGIGVTLNPDGSIASVDGPTIRRVTVAPTQADNAGSLALRTNGGVYVNVDGTAAGWIPIGGAAGWLLPDDVSGIWGTAAPGQVTSVYVSVANRWDLVGDNTTDLQASTAYRLRTGTSTAATANGAGTGLIEVATGATTASGAFTSGASGAVTIATGTTDRTDALAASGNSGVVTIASGNADSTLGVSGSSGNVSLTSGNSADANSGNVVLTTGTAGGARGVLDINALTIDIATQATQILAIDANAAALQIGSAGDLDMMTFVTTEGAEVVVVNALLGLRLNDAIPLRFGTPGTDVVFTPDTTGVTITATGVIQYNTDVRSSYGTTAADQWTIEYDGANRFDIIGTTVVAAGAAAVTRPMRIQSGDATVTDAAGGGASGSLTFQTGATDSTNAGGTGGTTGAITIQTGAATGSVGASGASGAVLIQTGATDGDAGVDAGNISLVTGNAGGVGDSGSIILTTGTSAGGTVGFLDINSTVIDTVTQPTTWRLPAAGATALRIGSVAAQTMMVFDVTADAEEITLNDTGLGINTVNGIRAIDNVAFNVGTAANDRFRFQYASVGTTGQIVGMSITGGGATPPQGTRPLLIETGARVKNDADAGVWTSGAVTVRSGTTSQTTAAATGGASGAAIFASGSTDVTFAGATGGASGTLTVQSGNTDIGGGVAATGGATGTVTVKSGDALSTSGTSDVSGNLTLSTGTSADAGTGTLTIESGAAQGAAGNTGNLTVRSGNAAGATLSGNVAVSTGTAAGVGTTGTISFTTGNPGGDGTTGPITATTGTTTGAAGTGLISLTTGGSGTGTTGNVNIITGNSPAGAGISGNIRLVTGTAGTTRGRVLVEAPILDLVTQATNLDLTDNNAAGLTVRAGAGGLAILTVVTTNAAEAFNYAARVTTTDGVAAGTARIVGGRAFASVADSAELAQAAAGYVAFDTTYSIPADTLKAGSVLRIVATVRVTTVLNAAATAQVQLQIGGANFGTSGESTAGAAGTRCRIVAEFTTRAAPGAGIATAGMASLQWSDTVAAVVLFPAAAVAVPTLATNGPLVVGVAVESSGAGDGSGRIVLEQLDIEII